MLMTSGCGVSSDEDQVRATAARFLSAVAAGSGTVACEQLSPALRRQLTKDQRTAACADAVLKVTLREHGVAKVRVFATAAIAELDGESLFLGLTGAGWRVDAIGCRPAGPGPYECEEQA
ncbi:MAG: hypothetical protein JWN65_3772 [Solirubrobacterales bacterium]|jgi:hypothetical protein|nr:hypothetical protein [Solirubrobacterales bacterium]